MPRILLVGRDPIRGLIDTAGADQGPRQRSKLLRVRRIARHGRGFAFSDRRAIGKAIARGPLSVRALRVRKPSPPTWVPIIHLRPPSAAPQNREESRRSLRKITRPTISGFPVSEVSGFPNYPISR